MNREDNVSKYYGEILQSNQDLKTNACCSADDFPKYLKDVLQDIHPEIQSKFYGCGSPIPPEVNGLKVLDLGCGTGRDAYMLSKLVGETGEVVGIDMTNQQLEVAKQYLDYHQNKFGHTQSNIRFVKGNIEDLSSIDLEDNYFDLVVSNCVINLTSSKENVFKEIFRVLKPGGEVYFSDVFADCKIPSELSQDPVLLGECLSGAMYIKDFQLMIRNIFKSEYYQLASAPIDIKEQEIASKLEGINLSSITVRVFKIPLEETEEDYGHSVIYQKSMEGQECKFQLGNNLSFDQGREVKVSANTAKVISRSRYSPHFDVIGEANQHFGPFQNKSSLNITNSCC